MNIGSGEEVTIQELVYKLKDIIGYKGEIVFDTSMPDGNPRKLLDSTKINSLGWKPKIALEEGLNNTVDWFIKNKSAN